VHKTPSAGAGWQLTAVDKKMRKVLPLKYSALLLIFLCLSLGACAGQQGSVQKGRGVYHTVKKGETLSQIAQAYQVSPRKLAETNQIRRPDQLEENSTLFIPGATRVVDIGKVASSPPGSVWPAKGAAIKGGNGKKTSAPAPSPNGKAEEKGKTAAAKGSGRQKQAATGEVSGKHPSVSTGDADRKVTFVWPVQGRVTARFGRQPNGMLNNHIRITARDHSQIVAAASGTVIFSAPLRDFGETIIIKHPDDFATVYTHLGNRAVKADAEIKKGEVIGQVGRSEKKGEGHIHFEIRRHNKAMNPLLFLP